MYYPSTPTPSYGYPTEVPPMPHLGSLRPVTPEDYEDGQLIGFDPDEAPDEIGAEEAWLQHVDDEIGYEGTSRGNLYMGSEDIVAQVRAYMDDSDASNIDAVGHRRWCLNPRMVKTGFGQTGKFGAMYAHDNSRRKIPEYDFVGYPAPGERSRPRPCRRSAHPGCRRRGRRCGGGRRRRSSRGGRPARNGRGADR